MQRSSEKLQAPDVGDREEAGKANWVGGLARLSKFKEHRIDSSQAIRSLVPAIGILLDEIFQHAMLLRRLDQAAWRVAGPCSS